MMPPRVLASGPKPCGGNEMDQPAHVFKSILVSRRSTQSTRKERPEESRRGKGRAVVRKKRRKDFVLPTVRQINKGFPDNRLRLLNNLANGQERLQWRCLKLKAINNY